MACCGHDVLSVLSRAHLSSKHRRPHLVSTTLVIPAVCSPPFVLACVWMWRGFADNRHARLETSRHDRRLFSEAVASQQESPLLLRSTKPQRVVLCERWDALRLVLRRCAVKSVHVVLGDVFLNFGQFFGLVMVAHHKHCNTHTTGSRHNSLTTGQFLALEGHHCHLETFAIHATFFPGVVKTITTVTTAHHVDSVRSCSAPHTQSFPTTPDRCSVQMPTIDLGLPPAPIPAPVDTPSASLDDDGLSDLAVPPIPIELDDGDSDTPERLPPGRRRHHICRWVCTVQLDHKLLPLPHFLFRVPFVGYVFGMPLLTL